MKITARPWSFWPWAFPQSWRPQVFLASSTSQTLGFSDIPSTVSGCLCSEGWQPQLEVHGTPPWWPCSTCTLTPSSLLTVSPLKWKTIPESSLDLSVFLKLFEATSQIQPLGTGMRTSNLSMFVSSRSSVIDWGRHLTPSAVSQSGKGSLSFSRHFCEKFGAEFQSLCRLIPTVRKSINSSGRKTAQEPILLWCSSGDGAAN